jgi:hypothetical protein
LKVAVFPAGYVSVILLLIQDVMIWYKSVAD